MSTNDIDHIKHYNADEGLDAVELSYSILNRSPEKDVLPFLQANKIAAVIRGPLKMGILTGKFTKNTSFPNGDIRKNWPREKWLQNSLEKVEHLRQLERDDQTLGQLALRYILNHPAVAVAIPGAKTPDQVKQNADASTRPLLANKELELIKEVAPL